jgi:RNA polymerase sigma-32 factor
MPLDRAFDQSLARRAMAAELLSAEVEADLARAWRDRRDEAALHRLVTAYMRLAVSVAARFRRYGAPMGDLVQEASLGLMKAAEKFDPDRGVRFSTYAVWWIRAAVQDYVMRNWSLVRTGSTTAQKSLFFNLHRVRARLERETAAGGDDLRRRVAAELGVAVADVEMMEGRLGGPDFSLDAVQSAEEDGRSWIEALEDDSLQAAERFETRHDAEALRGWLVRAMGRLPERERLILRERHLGQTPRTLESLAAELKLSKERVRQLEAAAFARLRRDLVGQSAEVLQFLG